MTKKNAAVTKDPVLKLLSEAATRNAQPDGLPNYGVYPYNPYLSLGAVTGKSNPGPYFFPGYTGLSGYASPYGNPYAATAALGGATVTPYFNSNYHNIGAKSVAQKNGVAPTTKHTALPQNALSKPEFNAPFSFASKAKVIQTPSPAPAATVVSPYWGAAAPTIVNPAFAPTVTGAPLAATVFAPTVGTKPYVY